MRRLWLVAMGSGRSSRFRLLLKTPCILDVVSKKFAWMNAEAILPSFVVKMPVCTTDREFNQRGRLTTNVWGTAISSPKSCVVSPRAHRPAT